MRKLYELPRDKQTRTTWQLLKNNQSRLQRLFSSPSCGHFMAYRLCWLTFGDSRLFLKLYCWFAWPFTGKVNLFIVFPFVSYLKFCVSITIILNSWSQFRLSQCLFYSVVNCVSENLFLLDVALLPIYLWILPNCLSVVKNVDSLWRSVLIYLVLNFLLYLHT